MRNKSRRQGHVRLSAQGLSLIAACVFGLYVFAAAEELLVRRCYLCLSLLQRRKLRWTSA